MSLSEAVRKRLNYFLHQKNLSAWGLYKATGIPRSTLCAFLNGRTSLIKLDTLLHICEGLNITLIDFFSDPVFKDVEQD